MSVETVSSFVSSEAPQKRKLRVPSTGWLWAVCIALVLAGICVSFAVPFVERVGVVRAIEAGRGSVRVHQRGPAWVRKLTGYHHLAGHPANPVFGLLDEIEIVTLERSAFRRELLPRLEAFPTLRELHLDYSTVTDDDMPAISRLKSLETLDLAHTRVSGRGFGKLREMPHLKFVNMTYTPMRDVAWQHLEAVKSLEGLSIFSCRHLTPSGLADFRAKNPKVNIIGIDTTERVWREIGKLPPEKLKLSR